MLLLLLLLLQTHCVYRARDSDVLMIRESCRLFTDAHTNEDSDNDGQELYLDMGCKYGFIYYPTLQLYIANVILYYY